MHKNSSKNVCISKFNWEVFPQITIIAFPPPKGSQENLLASQLLQPSSGTYGNSLSASQRSVGWGLEHSTFCLNDLVPQGAGPQRGGASPGHAHSGIAHWDQGDGQDDDDDDDNDDGQQAGPANSLFFNQVGETP